MNTNVQTKIIIAQLREQLLEAESILNTQYSFDLAEPSYIEALHLITNAQDQREKFIDLITSMFVKEEVSDEPIAFLMHALHWPEIQAWAKYNLEHMQHPIAKRRAFQKIIAAFSDEWENKEFYKFFVN